MMFKRVQTKLHILLLVVLMASCMFACQKDQVEIPELSSLEVTDITPYAAKSGGSISNEGGGQVSVRGLIWKSSPEVSIEDFEGMSVSGAGAGVFYANISGLSPGTSYYVRAYATNEAGTGYGEEIGFRTEATLAVVHTAEISDVTSETAVGGGEIAQDGGADVTARGVVWGTAPNPQLPGASGGFTEDGSGLGPFTSQISGLYPGTTYYVRAYATNSAGTEYGGQQQFVTEAVLPEVELVSVANITHVAATLNGRISFDGGDAITDRGFVYSTQPDPDMSASRVSAGSGGGDFSASVGELQASTTYYVRPYATNSIGTALGEQQMFETGSEPINDGDPCPDIPTVTDPRDNHVYNTVYIGGQCWLKEPMRWLPEVHHPHDGSNTEPRYYVNTYFGTDVNEARQMDTYIHYGALYNHPAATEACPPGWHLSSDPEWEALINYVANNYEEVDAGNVSNGLKSRRQLNSPLGSPWATDEHPRWDAHELQYGLDLVGFNAIPGGLRTTPPPGLPDMYFSEHGRSARFWTSTTPATYYYMRMFFNGTSVVGRNDLFSEYGASVRCVRDAR